MICIDENSLKGKYRRVHCATSNKIHPYYTGKSACVVVASFTASCKRLNNHSNTTRTYIPGSANTKTNLRFSEVFSPRIYLVVRSVRRIELMEDKSLCKLLAEGHAPH